MKKKKPATKKQKVAKWRKSVTALKRVQLKKTRFTTKLVHKFDTELSSGSLTISSLVKIFDNKAKKFIRGDWELSHAMAVLGHLLHNPDAAEKFGYEQA